jgi:UDP:flavonoid glycosyltransferase YjiC (YdhE family)
MESLECKKVFVLLIPSSGHVNPVAGIVSELTKQNVQVTFYGTEAYKPLIEKTGAIYKEYSYFPLRLTRNVGIHKERNTVLHLTSQLMKFSDAVLAELIADVDREQPDLILFDMLSAHAKYLLKILHKRYDQKLTSVKPPDAIKISPSFAHKPGVYPSWEEFRTFQKTNDIWFTYELAWNIVEQVRFSWKYGLDIINPVSFFHSDCYEKMIVTTVFRDFQPRGDQFDERYKFVGACISEPMRSIQTMSPRLRQVMDTFAPVNPVESVDQLPRNDGRKLIYVSLGTVFNNNIFVFDAIMSAVQRLENELKSSEKLELVMAVGERVFKQYQDRVADEGQKIADNIVIEAFVPQIEVLKRAALYVTHAGMNSASEAVHYAVPVICIPIQADQPLVARRMADELNLGKQFDPLDLNVDKLARAINEILSDSSYLERTLALSRISRKHDGNVNGCKEILNFLYAKNN